MLLFRRRKDICIMETEVKNNRTFVKVPEKGLLSLVAEKLKDRILFPHKLEEAKDYLKKVTFRDKG
jgi:hypothetical protein